MGMAKPGGSNASWEAIVDNSGEVQSISKDSENWTSLEALKTQSQKGIMIE